MKNFLDILAQLILWSFVLMLWVANLTLTVRLIATLLPRVWIGCTVHPEYLIPFIALGALIWAIKRVA